MALDCPALSLISDGSEVLPDQPKGGRIAPSIWPNYSDRVAELLRNPGRVAPKNANDETDRNWPMTYETDLLVVENLDEGKWTPRVVIEAKGNGAINTHDAITYSHKAASHRQIHPYLRYGILLGERKHYPLPGRLFRHGTQFDFMISWVKHEPNQLELDYTLDVLLKEVDASRILERIIYDSRKKGRDHYTVLHKELKVRQQG